MNFKFNSLRASALIDNLICICLVHYYGKLYQALISYPLFTHPKLIKTPEQCVKYVQS